MGFSVGPSVVNRQVMSPLAPGQCHVAARLGVLGISGDFVFVGDGDSGISGEDLTFFLFPCVNGKGEAQVDAGMEVGHVIIQIRLEDLGIGVEDVHDKGMEIDGIETFGGAIKNGIQERHSRCC
jgi:hypothetical protein